VRSATLLAVACAITGAPARAEDNSAKAPPREELPIERGPRTPPAGVRREAWDGSVALGPDALRVGLPELVLPNGFRRFNAADAVLTGVGLAATLTAAIVPPVEAHRRSGGVLVDEEVRSALRASSFQGRYLARDTSDVLLSLLATYPFFLDAAATAWWYRGNADVARQIALVNLEALAFAGMLQGITNVLAARERPYGRDCGGILSAGSVDCEGAVRYRSFFSGHAMFSFTAASVSCSHHLYLGLYANRLADAASCVTGYLAAAATATLRVVGDMHYASDVALGALVGSAVGLGIPWLHYHTGHTGALLPTSAVRLHLVPLGAGAALGGSF
jgi:membrane-associated phospholipid phosphatase